MSELTCPSCGTLLELGLIATNLNNSNPTSNVATIASPQDAIAESRVATRPMTEVRQHRLKGHQIEVTAYGVVEAVMEADQYTMGSPSRWRCAWLWDDKYVKLPVSVRAVLMAYLLSKYPAIDWKNLGITTNDAIRIIGQCPGFHVSELDVDGGDISWNGKFAYPRKDEWLPEY